MKNVKYFPPPFSAVFEMRDSASFRLHNFSLVGRHLPFFLFLWKTKRPLLGYRIRSLAPNVMRAAWYELGRIWYPSIWNSGLFCLPKNKKLVFFIGFFPLASCSWEDKMTALPMVGYHIFITHPSKLVATPWSQLLSALQTPAGIKHAPVDVNFLGATYQEALPSRKQSFCLLFGALGQMHPYCYIPLNFVKWESDRLPGGWNYWIVYFW